MNRFDIRDMRYDFYFLAKAVFARMCFEKKYDYITNNKKWKL